MANEPAKKNTATEVDRPFQDMIRSIAALAEANPIDSWEIAANVIDTIATAETPEAIFAANESGPSDINEYFNTPLEVYDPKFARSDPKYAKGTLGFYVVFQAIDPNGEKLTISTGANNVVASIYRLHRLGFITEDKALPVRFLGRETANGTLYTVHAG